MADTEKEEKPNLVHEAIKAMGRLKERIIKQDERISNLEKAFEMVFKNPDAVKAGLEIFLEKAAQVPDKNGETKEEEISET